MKKTNIFIALLVLLVAGIVTIISCDKKNSPDTATTQTPKHAVNARFGGILSSYPDAILQSDANTMIAAYARDPNKLKTSSFLFNASELLSYINNCGNIQYISFFIGEYTNANKTTVLTLIFCGVDNNGNFIYMTDANNNNYALEHCMPCPTCNIVNNGINLETPGPTNSSYTANYTQNTAVAMCQTWISNYINDQKKNTNTTSFLYDPVVLGNYLSNAPNINQIHILLAENGNGNLTVILAGVDKNGNHIYITDGQGNFYALDTACPCPYCDVVNNGCVNLD